ncbi:MAG: DUF1553 domain-containing protein [Planctomycetaceae bacterium]
MTRHCISWKNWDLQPESVSIRKPDSRGLSVAIKLGFAVVFILSAPQFAQAVDSLFRVTPETVEMSGKYERTQLVVSSVNSNGEFTDRSQDLTHAAQYQSSNPQVVTVNDTGRLLAVGNGSAEITVTVQNKKLTVPVTVRQSGTKNTFGYASHVMPILSKAGCNMGACHASQYGKGGFKLSVFGFQPTQDHAAILRDRQQRRVNLLHPERSLFLRKPTMEIPHGGGLRLKKNSVDYRILAEWIRAGAPAARRSAPKVERIELFPKRRVGKLGLKQQLRVIAHYSDNSVRDVTAWAKFDSMDEALLAVDLDGYVTAIGKGQAPVMVRFEGQAEISMFVIPYAESVQLAGWQNRNFIDERAADKFRELGIEPSAVCDDATFLRRAFFDAIGTLPTVDETRRFLNSTDPKKREKLVDRLLGLTGDPEKDIYNNEYAAYWTLKWSDLIRNQSNKVGEQGMWAMHNWIKESFRTNKPFDQFVRELVTAKGSIYSNGPANYFRINSNSSDLTESTVQLFLGIRLQCAKCHHHPFEKYSQEDYQGFARFFSRVGTKNSQEFGLFGRESVVVVRATGNVKGRTLDGDLVTHPLDLRIPLAEWLTSPKNEYFAKSIVNRYVAYLLGRGLVEPIDDLRETNPPSNVALLDQLTKDFIKNKFNVKKLIRTIMLSRLYQTKSQPTKANASDRRFYSHFKVKRISAEPLLDAIDRATGVPTKFKSLPSGTRAIELPDAEYPNYFLTTFGKPKRASVCECERVADENLAQALHTLNGDTLYRKITSPNGRVAKLLKAKTSHEKIIEELYLATLCRKPSDKEQEVCRQFLKESPSPKECYEDILWALLNSKQFLFVH